MRDPITGNTIRWRFEDGPSGDEAYEHHFDLDGTVRWNAEGEPPSDDSQAKYEIAPVSDDVFAVSYLSKTGWTLTTILNFDTHELVAFASNEKELIAQHGNFELENHDDVRFIPADARPTAPH